MKEEIYEVDLGGFLCGSGMKLQNGADGDRRGVLPEDLLHDELRSIKPRLERLSFRISIWEQDNPMASQGVELVWLYVPHASGRKPQVLWEVLTENDRGLL